MNNKRFAYLTLCLGLVMLTSCKRTFDDTSLWNRLEGIEGRVSALEDRCKRMNTNIAALKGLATVSASSDRITSIVPLTEDGIVTAYTFYFCFSDPVTVYCATDGTDGTDGIDGQNGTNGRDGLDGVVPVVGTREVNGVLYWTLDGEFLLDDAGNKIPLVTSGGLVVDGRTPELKVEAGVWYYRMSPEESWVQLEVKSEYGDGNIFSSVTQDNENVVFSLSDGTVLSIPKKQILSLEISPAGDQTITAGTSVRINWRMATDDDVAEVDAFAQGTWSARIERDGFAKEGTLLVSAPADAAGTCPVILFATGSDGLSAYLTINFTVL